MPRLSLLLAPPLAAAALAAGTAAPAVASVKPCARSAKVIHGTVAIPGYSGAPTALVRDESKDKVVHHLHLRPVVVKSRHATILFQHVTYRVTKGSMIVRTCFGESVGSTVLFPSLRMFNGSAVVHAPAGHPGAVDTSEALINPYQRAGQTFSVKLTHTSPDNVEQGTVTVRRTAGNGLVNVTPYVGPQPGTCRDVLKARLVSPSRRHKQGLAYYDGHLAH